MIATAMDAVTVHRTVLTITEHTTSPAIASTRQPSAARLTSQSGTIPCSAVPAAGGPTVGWGVTGSPESAPVVSASAVASSMDRRRYLRVRSSRGRATQAWDAPDVPPDAVGACRPIIRRDRRRSNTGQTAGTGHARRPAETGEHLVPAVTIGARRSGEPSRGRTCVLSCAHAPAYHARCRRRPAARCAGRLAPPKQLHQRGRPARARRCRALGVHRGGHRHGPGWWTRLGR